MGWKGISRLKLYRSPVDGVRRVVLPINPEV